ncbi:translation initiation factor IF-2-like [Elephas maximus indicus]|uniref:translation initiation factor IF-2-like n=1 Tax=Elephas maximus indicus TaxID=99487 RepID=UPI0021164A6F|nr:translation initiation factor IF-2-like [Elephas maximus indicus]
MHRGRRGGRLLRAPASDSGVPGQRLLPPRIGRSPVSPPGARSAQRRLRHKLCGRGERGRWPTPQHGPRWPGQGGPRRCPAGDQLRRRGGERGRAPPQLLRARSGLPAEAVPPEPVTHLPNPAPARPRSLPPARGAGDATARPSQVPAPSPVPWEPGRESFGLNGPRLGAQQPLSHPAPPPRPQAPPLKEGCPSPPWTCPARSRQARDPGSAPPLHLSPVIGS